MRPRVEHLSATDDSGATCQLTKTTPYRRIRSMDGDSWIDELPTVRTSDGEHCNPDGPGRYIAIRSNRRFTLIA
jgi:hypothetical protein